MTRFVQTEVEEGVFQRMQAHSVPLTDTVSSVIARLLDFYEANNPEEVKDPDGSSQKGTKVIECDPAAPPNLRHTVPDIVKLEGQDLPYNQRYWNNLMIEIIRLAAAKVAPEEIFDLVIVNKAEGVKTDNNFNYIKEADLSVQLQNSVAAWKAIYHIASRLGLSVEVEFHWNVKENAAHPGCMGRLKI